MPLFCLLPAWLPVLVSLSKPVEVDNAEGNFSNGLWAQKICLKEGAHIPCLFLEWDVTATGMSFLCAFRFTFFNKKRYCYSSVVHVQSVPKRFYMPEMAFKEQFYSEIWFWVFLTKEGIEKSTDYGKIKDSKFKLTPTNQMLLCIILTRC